MMRFTACFWRRNSAAIVPQSAPPPGLHPLVRARMICCYLLFAFVDFVACVVQTAKAQRRSRKAYATSTRMPRWFVAFLSGESDPPCADFGVGVYLAGKGTGQIKGSEGTLASGVEPEMIPSVFKISSFFCGLDPGNLKFETVRTNKQHICF